MDLVSNILTNSKKLKKKSIIVFPENKSVEINGYNKHNFSFNTVEAYEDVEEILRILLRENTRYINYNESVSKHSPKRLTTNRSPDRRSNKSNKTVRINESENIYYSNEDSGSDTEIEMDDDQTLDIDSDLSISDSESDYEMDCTSYYYRAELIGSNRCVIDIVYNDSGSDSYGGMYASGQINIFSKDPENIQKIKKAVDMYGDFVYQY